MITPQYSGTRSSKIMNGTYLATLERRRMSGWLILPTDNSWSHGCDARNVPQGTSSLGKALLLPERSLQDLNTASTNHRSKQLKCFPREEKNRVVCIIYRESVLTRMRQDGWLSWMRSTSQDFKVTCVTGPSDTWYLFRIALGQWI